MKKKICFVILGLDYSGAEIVLNKYLENNEEVDPFFVFIFEGKAAEKYESIYGIQKVVRLCMPYFKNELRFFPWVLEKKIQEKLEQLTEKMRPDLIYVNNTLEVMLCKMAAKKIRIPFAGHVHDVKESYGTFIKQQETAAAFAYYDTVLTVSEACKKSWKNETMQVIYNGIEEKKFCFDSVPSKIEKIGYAGMISKRKGFDFLAEMIGEDEKYQWKIAYNIVEAGCEKDLERIRQRKNVCIFKEIPSAEMTKFYDEIDLLVIPSRYDPLPTVAIEAMARGKAVIGFREGGIPELLGDRRWIVDQMTATAMKERIDQLSCLDGEALMNMRKSLYDRSKKHFTAEKKEEKINGILDCILQRK